MSEETQTEELNSWLDDHPDLSEGSRKALSKYDSLEKALDGGANAILNIGKPDKGLGLTALKSIDVEKLSDTEKVELSSHINRLTGVPDTPEGYVIPKPENMPEGMPWDDDFEKVMRDVAKKANAPNASVAELAKAYNDYQVAIFESQRKAAKETVDELQKDWGDDFVSKMGDPDNPEVVGTCRQAAMEISKELGLDYQEDGKPRSKLLDCFEFVPFNGNKCPLGNMAPILRMLDLYHSKVMKRGSMLPGGATTVKLSPEQEKEKETESRFPISSKQSPTVYKRK